MVALIPSGFLAGRAWWCLRWGIRLARWTSGRLGIWSSRIRVARRLSASWTGTIPRQAGRTLRRLRGPGRPGSQGTSDSRKVVAAVATDR